MWKNYISLLLLLVFPWLFFELGYPYVENYPHNINNFVVGLYFFTPLILEVIASILLYFGIKRDGLAMIVPYLIGYSLYIGHLIIAGADPFHEAGIAFLFLFPIGYIFAIAAVVTAIVGHLRMNRKNAIQSQAEQPRNFANFIAGISLGIIALLIAFDLVSVWSDRDQLIISFIVYGLLYGGITFLLKKKIIDTFYLGTVIGVTFLHLIFIFTN